MSRSIEIVTPPAVGKRLSSPMRPHLVLNNRCQLRCDWCWGPDHAEPEQATAQDWQQLIGKLAVAESRPYIQPADRVTISGGEPLLSPLLLPVLEATRMHRMRTKLSTNGIFLRRLAQVLPLVDELAVGVDGNDEKSHALVRKGAAAHGAFTKAAAAARLAQEHDKPVTVRTVVTKKNWGVIPTIPIKLEQAGVDLSRVRHKLYQLEPIGPRKDRFSMDEWGVSAEDVLDIAGRVKGHYPEMNVCVQLYGLTDARYLNFESSGRAYGVEARPPERIPREVEYGNAFTDFDGMYKNYVRHWFDSLSVAAVYEHSLSTA